MPTLIELEEHIKSKAPGEAFTICEATVAHNQLTLHTQSDCLPQLVRFLKEDDLCLFRLLIDITAVDYPNLFPNRFQLVYHLLSLHHNQRIRLKITLKENELAPSLTSIFPAADWYEREVFDMFGICFAYHPDLRRILTDYGFEGFPLRKDFPLTGFVEVRYDDEKKRVAYDSVSLTQEFRTFSFESPWDMENVVTRGQEDVREEV